MVQLRRQPETAAVSLGVALSLSAWRESRVERRQASARDCAHTNWAMDLFNRFNDIDAGEWQSEGPADPLDRCC
jgi:hypothetical protein